MDLPVLNSVVANRKGDRKSVLSDKMNVVPAGLGLGIVLLRTNRVEDFTMVLQGRAAATKTRQMIVLICFLMKDSSKLISPQKRLSDVMQGEENPFSGR